MCHWLIGMLLSNAAASRAAGWQKKWNSPSREHYYLSQRISPVSCDFYGFFFNRFFRNITWMLLGLYAIPPVQAWVVSHSKGFTYIIQVFSTDTYLESFVFVHVFSKCCWLSHKHSFSQETVSLLFLKGE